LTFLVNEDFGWSRILLLLLFPSSSSFFFFATRSRRRQGVAGSSSQKLRLLIAPPFQESRHRVPQRQGRLPCRAIRPACEHRIPRAFSCCLPQFGPFRIAGSFVELFACQRSNAAISSSSLAKRTRANSVCIGCPFSSPRGRLARNIRKQKWGVAIVGMRRCQVWAWSRAGFVLTLPGAGAIDLIWSAS